MRLGLLLGSSPILRLRRQRTILLRLAALRSYDILDSAEEEIYNSITRAAAEVCQTSMASLTFIDENRQWFKSRLGLASQETPRDISFCAHAINHSAPLMIPDALLDRRFEANPFVTGAPHLRFYAGISLRTSSGLALGTLCVLDTAPKVLDERQLESLKALAASAGAGTPQERGGRSFCEGHRYDERWSDDRGRQHDHVCE